MDTPHPDPDHGFLRCTACGRAEPATPVHLPRFLATGAWPSCCGEVMTFDAPGDRRPEPPPDR